MRVCIDWPSAGVDMGVVGGGRSPVSIFFRSLGREEREGIRRGGSLKG